MRIEAIRGRNIASLKGDFSLDFTSEPLASAGIFTISGPTGAGKSTILDTMCLALFGRTPRTEQAKENNVKIKDIKEDALAQSDPRFLLRRGTASGYAEVDFLALNGRRYRARWSVSRAREKENGRLKSAAMSLVCLDDPSAPVSGKNKEVLQQIAQLIGLTFEQFTRSVLLAQNDFATFLKAEQGDKATLLEKLTGTDVYSQVSRIIFARNAEAKTAYEIVQAKIQGVELLSQEEVERLETTRQELTARLSGIEKDRKERSAKLEALRNASAQIDTLKKQETEAQSSLQQAQVLLDSAQQKMEESVALRQQEENAFRLLQPELLAARKLDILLDALQKVLTEKKSALEKAKLDRGEGEKRYRVALRQWEQGKEAIGSLTQWFEVHRSKEHIAEQLPTLLLHLNAAEGYKQQSEQLQQSLYTLYNKQTLLNSELKSKLEARQTLAKSCQTLEKKIEEAEAVLKQTDAHRLEQEANRLQQEREQMLIEKARFGTTGDIKALRARLVEGEPCPVCGSNHHPYALPETDIRLQQLAKQIDLATLRLQQLQEQRAEIARREKLLNETRRQFVSAQQQLMREASSGKDLENKQSVISEQIKNTQARLADMQQQLGLSLREAGNLFGHEEWTAGWAADPAKFRSTLSNFAEQWKEHQAELLKLQQDSGRLQSTTETYLALLPALQEQESKAALDYQEQRDALNARLAERKSLLDGANPDKVDSDYKQRLEALREKQKALADTQSRQIAAVAQSKGRLELIEQNCRQALLLREEAERLWKEWAEAYEARSGGVDPEVAFEETTRRLNETAFRLRTHQENKQRIQTLAAELARTKQESELWAKLNDLAGSADGSKFRRVAQGYTLDVLLSHANVHLKELTMRYRLERIPDTLALQVIDRDMCDEVRTVHSLSGGEAFLVSLALALGLSSLSSNRMKVESLFIDEGFGSLDAETLRVALDALENLRTQGRKIGVISHVQEMSERIPVHIKVEPTGGGTSCLSISY